MLNEILSALVAVATLQNLLIMVAGIWGGLGGGAACPGQRKEQSKRCPRAERKRTPRSERRLRRLFP